ncbi:hypothetical protein PMI35_02079 [Pseudomonas sp. GM78]|nr:hypothetical protein PMI35_02079 [Pseudomonas sp. GM78]
MGHRVWDQVVTLNVGFMERLLSFEVNWRYEMRVDSVSEAMARYDETYRLIGAWLERTGASGEFAVYRGSPLLKLPVSCGTFFRWKSDDNA